MKRVSRQGDRSRRWWLIPFLGLSVIVVSLIGRLVWLHAVVAKGIPEEPTLTDWPAPFLDRVARANITAHGYFHPANGLVDLSRLYHANGFYNEALQCYETLRRLQPRNAHWAHLEASILAGFGRADEALPLYRNAAESDAHYLPTQVKLGDVLLKAGHPDEAAKVYRDALKVDASNPYALLGLARVAINRENYSEAQLSLREALKQHPDFNRGLDLLVTVDEKMGDHAEANELKSRMSQREFNDIADPWLDELTDACFDPYRLSVAADVAKSYGNAPSALALLARAIELAPSAGSYHRQRGLILFDLNNYPSARLDAEKATALSPEDPYAWTFLIKVLSATKENEAAWRALSEGLQHCPLSPDLHLERGRRLNTAGGALEAIGEFKEAHRLWPSEAGPLVELANTYFKVNQPSDALDALHEALQRQPENALALVVLTIYEISVGHKAAALSWWQRLRVLPQVPPQAIAGVKQAYSQKFHEVLP